MTSRNKDIPRPFFFDNLGEGEIIEEAVMEYEEWAPAIQLLRFNDGKEMLRLCYYTKTGKLAPRALSLDSNDISNLRRDLKRKPHVRSFLKELLGDE